MPILPTAIDPSSAEFRENYGLNRALVEELAARQAQVRQGGSDRARQRHVERGKLLPRERVELLLDPGAPFLELSTLAAWGMYDDESPGASGINGIGVVRGVEMVVNANDATVKGGASYPVSVKKALRAQEIAAQNRLPCVYLVESAGANLLYQAEFFADLGGPPLGKMATGEEVDDESLGGAEMHTRVSGLADYLAEDDADAIRLGRDIVGRLNWRKDIRAALAPPEEPAYDPDELLGILPADIRRPFEMREGIARLVDAPRFEEFKRDFGRTLACGHAHLAGFPIGPLPHTRVPLAA